jgi:hypothetical protein
LEFSCVRLSKLTVQAFTEAPVATEAEEEEGEEDGAGKAAKLDAVYDRYHLTHTASLFSASS